MVNFGCGFCGSWDIKEVACSDCGREEWICQECGHVFRSTSTKVVTKEVTRNVTQYIGEESYYDKGGGWCTY